MSQPSRLAKWDGTARDYYLHGLIIRSELPLQEPPSVRSKPDVTLGWSPEQHVSLEQSAESEGEVLAELTVNDRLLYQVSRSSEDIQIHFPEICRFLIAPDLGSVVCYLEPDANPDLIPILAAGYLMAILLTLQGECVLHASAVTINGLGIGLVGASGMGKSTSATLLCAGGAKLVTDDLLRINLEAGSMALGSSHLRLRPQAQPIVDMFEPVPRVENTADGRLAIYPPRGPDNSSLAALVVPQPSQKSEVVLEAIPAAQGPWLLARFPRILGWRSPEIIARQFRQFSRLSRSVPIFKLHIPWGPPFRASLPKEIVDRIVQSVH